MLLCTFCGERKRLRKLHSFRVLKAKLEHKNDVRKFVVYKLNFHAEDFIDMIKWMDITITEPPMTKYIIDEDLKSCEAKKTELPVAIYRSVLFTPQHTSSRKSYKACESLLRICRPEAREGFIKVNALQKMMTIIFYLRIKKIENQRNVKLAN